MNLNSSKHYRFFELQIMLRSLFKKSYREDFSHDYSHTLNHYYIDVFSQRKDSKSISFLTTRVRLYDDQNNIKLIDFHIIKI